MEELLHIRLSQCCASSHVPTSIAIHRLWLPRPDQVPSQPFHSYDLYTVPLQATPEISHVMQDILDSGTHSHLLAAAQLLKSYNGALQHQVSRHQYAVHILQVLLKEQVMTPRYHYHHCHCCNRYC